jgi:triosephosphate isomerase (TIM)
VPPEMNRALHSGGAVAPVLGASLKMHLTAAETRAYCRSLRSLLTDLPDREVFILPPFTAIATAAEELAGSGIAWGGQDVHPEDSGPHTGDVSAPMLAELGCRYVEIGHSERRRDHGESPELIGRKLAAVLRWRMTPVLCVGETTYLEMGPALAEVTRSLDRSISSVEPEQLARVIIAYEPVWAIGAGARAASPARVAAMHRGLRSWLAQRHPAGSTARIIYGGSVDGRSAPGLLAQPEVDGLFVGRFALDPAGFAGLVRGGERTPAR